MMMNRTIPLDPRLELVDKQFNLRMKELFTQTSSGQLVPITIEATLQQTTDGLMQHLTKSHPLTWVSQFKTTPEEDELPLWMSLMKDFALVDRNSVPSMLLVLATRDCFTSMKEVDCSKLIIGTESDNIFTESNSSF